MLAKMAQWWAAQTQSDLVWLGFGLFGQAMFSMRWIVQWLASEKKRASTVPDAFWYFSFVGGLLVMAYGIHKVDPVIILGQFGVLVYARNIYFLRRGKAGARKLGGAAE